MADVIARHDPVENELGRLLQPIASALICVALDLFLFSGLRIDLVGLFTLDGIRKNDVQPFAQSFELRDQLLVVKLVQRGVDFPRVFRAVDEAGQSLDHVARQTCPQRVVLVADLLQQTFLVWMSMKRTRYALRRNQPAVEKDVESRSERR